MARAKQPTLYPSPTCPWNSQYRDEQIFWESGGEANNSHRHQSLYMLIAPVHLSVVTAALMSEPGQKGFDYLYIRVSVLDAYFLQLDPTCTTLIFVSEEGSGYTSRSHLSFLKWHAPDEETQQLTKLMKEEDVPQTVEGIQAFFRANRTRDLTALVPLKPYQRHLSEYRGLKLGLFILEKEMQPATDEHLAAQEKKYGYALPDDYRDFILKTNGGDLKNRVYFQAKGLRKPRQLVCFNRLREDRRQDTRPWTTVPGFLYLGYDEKNEGLYLGLDEAVRGKVVSVSDLCDGFCTRKGTPTERLTARGVRHIADSFSAFIDGLEITDEVI